MFGEKCSICGAKVMCDRKKHKEFEKSPIWRNHMEESLHNPS